MATKSSIVSVVGIVAYLFRDEIHDGICSIYNELKKYTNDIIYKQLVIDKNQYKCYLALNEELKKVESNMYIVKDSNTDVTYNAAHKRYVIDFDGYNIFIDVTGDRILIYNILGDMGVLKKYLENIFKKYCSYDKTIMYYSIDELKWRFPIFRRPRDYKLDNNNKQVIQFITNFKDSEETYCLNGQNYNLGVAIIGKPGIGKSTTIEIISKMYEMPIYLINFNTDNLNDTVLLNLFSSVPPHSIIVIEEIEKQIEAMMANESICVTYSGILNAMDGLPRLNHGVIMITTGNNLDNLNDDFKKPLLREGRLGKVFNYV